MSPIKDFTLRYVPLNEENTFTAGDIVLGLVTFTLSKDTKVKSLFVKIKGDVNVKWTEHYLNVKEVCRGHIRCFKLKEYLVAESSQGTLLPKGLHRFKFLLRIPQMFILMNSDTNVPAVRLRDMPSSFKGDHGKIVYVLEAKMSRSWRCPTGVRQDLKFVSKSILHHGQEMCPQSGSVDKEVGIFSKGLVQMSASLDRKVCSPGDTLSVVAEVRNSSTKKMRPKYSLHQEIVYQIQIKGKTRSKICQRTLCKMVGHTIAPNSEETASCRLKIPRNVIYTLHNCDMISVKYYLKVYLDIRFSFDPEVVFPLIIVPASSAAVHPDEAVGPHPAGAVGASSDSDFPAPADTAPTAPLIPRSHSTGEHNKWL